jgi:hypothetical protein
LFKNKEKIKVPVTISEKEIEKIILGKKENIIQAGFDNVFSDFYLQDVENLSVKSIGKFYDGLFK